MGTDAAGGAVYKVCSFVTFLPCNALMLLYSLNCITSYAPEDFFSWKVFTDCMDCKAKVNLIELRAQYLKNLYSCASTIPKILCCGHHDNFDDTLLY